MLQLAIFFAGVWRSAGLTASDTDPMLIQISAASVMTQAPLAGLLSTCDLNNDTGVPCPGLVPACFAAYDRNNDSCISKSECALQVALTSCDTVEWNPDKDKDDCINSAEFEHINAITNGSVCPLPPLPTSKTCPAGTYIKTNSEPCEVCENGATRRRRSLSCTPCEGGSYDAGQFDDCLCQKEPYLMEREVPAGSSVLAVQIPPPDMAVGDNISIVTRMSGQVFVNTSVCEGGKNDCRTPSIDTVIIKSIDGSNITIDRPLSTKYARFDSVMLTCTVTDGTAVSGKRSGSCSGGGKCQCGLAQCEGNAKCNLTGGTGVCIGGADSAPWRLSFVLLATAGALLWG